MTAGIRINFRDVNGHISEATNTALAMATGTYLAFLDHDDLLDRDALLLIASLRDNPDAQIVYTDEDIISIDGSRDIPIFKPDWNRLLLYEANYICHFCVIDAALVRKLGGLRRGFEGARTTTSYYVALSLSVTNRSSTFQKFFTRGGPLQAVLPHHLTPSLTQVKREDAPLKSTCIEPLGKPSRSQWARSRSPISRAGRLRVRPLSQSSSTRDHLDGLQTAVSSILERTAYKHFEIIIVDNSLRKSATLEWLNQIVSRESRFSTS